MLVLTRDVNEIIRIGGDILIKVLSVDGKQVRIGVDAPREVEIHREEIFRRMQNAPRKKGGPASRRPAAVSRCND